MITIAGRLKNLSSQSGIYFFKNKKGQVIYIGKSGNLKNRVKSYFPSQGEVASGRLNAAKVKMLSEIAGLEILRTDSEIEALIKEAKLIKKYKPKFNVLMRDSKNYLFVGFTKEEYPRLVLTHQPSDPSASLRANKLIRADPKTKKLKRSVTYKLINYIGPFTDAGAAVKTLRLLRNIFPYCTCKQKHNAKCLNAHLGKCLAVCCLKSSLDKLGTSPRDPDLPAVSYRRGRGQQLKKQYQKNIRAIKTILLGHGQKLLRSLERELGSRARIQDFEQAQKIKEQIDDLKDVLDHARVLTEEKIFLASPAIFKDIKPNFRLLGLRRDPKRIETYDISNIQGQEAAGSMVVFVQKDGNYIADKSQYRKFKIKTVRGINDIAMMAEVIKRRCQHTEWPLPQLIVIDGGRGQLNAALRATNPRKIRVISLAKRLEEIYLPERPYPLLAQSFGQATKHLLQAIRDEAHRFAITYHRKLHRWQIIPK